MGSMPVRIGEIYLAEIERHQKSMAEIDAECERLRVAGELSAADETAWLEALYRKSELEPRDNS